jgi:hypothetical protein
MKRAFAAAIVALVVSGPAWGGDDKFVQTSFGEPVSCGAYIDAYLEPDEKKWGNYRNRAPTFLMASWYIKGFLDSAGWANHNFQPIVLTMTQKEVFRWIATYCRDKKSDASINHAIIALIRSRPCVSMCPRKTNDR